MNRTYLVCALGIYGCFLLWQLFQEYIVVTEINGKRFRYFVFLNLLQSATAAIVGVLYMKFQGGKIIFKQNMKAILPLMLCSLLGSISPLFGYRAIKYVDYPTIILGKSCKLVPIVIMKLLFFRVRIPPSKFLVVLVVTTGLYIFMREPPTRVQHNQNSDGLSGFDNLKGISLIGTNLILDGLTNSIQDQIFYNTKFTGPQMMFFTGTFTTLILSLYFLLLRFGEFSNIISFLTQNPSWVPYIGLFALSGSLGQCFVYHTLRELGSLSLVTLTMTRKMGSILLNIILFNHRLSRLQWAGIAAVFFGIAIDAKCDKLSAHRRPPLKKIKK